ncbi:DUF4351 domain-containing protein [Clostridium estertheticum]|uniref:DUF4351 domain-containing protein n=1 Tax=Clostridium estertheticum TaxID=238834 RepID=UPI0022DE9017|nr:DUF4351 domain-containing protein [Clostridium estertheticum]WBL45249.1 DUF4351 domain-containing protein [Clostridium estertheticum]
MKKKKLKEKAKGWIKNTTNSNEIYNMNELVDNIFNENKKEEVEIMVSNASNIFGKLKSDGIKEGKAELLITQLKRRFNGLSDYYTDKIRSLPEGVIDKIATDIFDLETVEDIKKYL